MAPEAMSALTSAGVVVGVQQVTIATGAVVSSDVVVAEMIAEHVPVALLAALVYVYRGGTRGDRKQASDEKLKQTAPFCQVTS